MGDPAGPRFSARLVSCRRPQRMLAQLHHNQRGLPKQRYKVWTVLHNFDCRAADGTTPASRFFRRGRFRISLKQC